MDELIRQKQRLRQAFLKAVYEISGGDTTKWVDGAAVKRALGLDRDDELKEPANYLDAEYLIKVEKRIGGGLPALMKLQHGGVVEIERALSNPDEPTEHFAPRNVLYIENMVNSVVQQGTVNSNQTVTISADGLTHLKRFIAEVEAHIAAAKGESEELRELRAEVETLRVQLQSPKPKASIIKASLESLRSIAEHSTAVLVGYSLLPQVKHLLTILFPP